MKVIKYLDKYVIHKPKTGNAPVHTLEPAGPVSIEQLQKEHPEVFEAGVGRLEGKYRIVLDNSIQPSAAASTPSSSCLV